MISISKIIISKDILKHFSKKEKKKKILKPTTKNYNNGIFGYQ